MKILEALNSFTAKVLIITTIIFVLTSSFPLGEDPQVIKLCDTTFVLKKYTVYPPSGYFNSWVVNPEVTIVGSSTENTLTIKWSEPGNYTIIAQFSNGECISTSKMDVIVEGCPDFTLYIPNAFTPDGDNINDVFGAYGTEIEEFGMEIYNRWGELLFISNSLEYRWDGYYKDNLCQKDVYIYKIRYKSKNLSTKHIYGRFVLLI